jgi:hypothetical protein
MAAPPVDLDVADAGWWSAAIAVALALAIPDLVLRIGRRLTSSHRPHGPTFALAGLCAALLPFFGGAGPIDVRVSVGIAAVAGLIVGLRYAQATSRHRQRRKHKV